MKSNNHVQLIGHLGAAPEIKTLQNGGKLTRFTIAVNESYISKKGNKVKHTEWHNINVWGSLATIAGRVLKKGTKVNVSGKLVNYHYTDKDGNKFVTSQIVANQLWAVKPKND